MGMKKGGDILEYNTECYKRFLNGEQKAFDELIINLFDNVVFFINRYIHNLYTSEDIAIDTFCELIIHKHSYNFKTPIKTYIYMIARSKALNYLKHEKILSFISLDDVPLSCENSATNDDLKLSINNSINKLPIDMKTAIYLTYIEGFSYKEASIIMKKSTKQIDNLIYRAKKKLRTILGEEIDII